MITTTKNLRTIRLAGAKAWRPREFPPTPVWCERNIQLPAATEATPGRFDLDRRPYWREPLAMFDDPAVETITIQKATQLGGTVSLMAAALSRAVIAPSPGMVVTPDRDSCTEIRDRIYGLALETPATRRLVPPERYWNNRHVDLGTMRLYLAFSGSRQRMRGRPCRYVLMTEVDVYKKDARAGAAIRAGRERVKAFYRSKILFESSPTDDDSDIANLYDQSDRRLWFVPCPRCGRWQFLRCFCHTKGKHAGRGGIGSFRDDHGNWNDPERARADAHYLCLSGCRIDQADKATMIEAGRWVPHGQTVNEHGELAGTPTKPARDVGYQLSSLVSDQVSFADMVGAYHAHKEAGQLPEFWNNWLGLRWTTRRPLPTYAELGRRLSSTNRRGHVPTAAWFLTGSADVQEDKVYFSVRAWGDRRTSWQVDWGILERQPEIEGGGVASDLAKLDRIVNRRYRVDGANPLGKRELRLRVFGIDANYRPADIHDWIQTHGKTDRIRAIRGDHTVNPKEGFRMTVVERNVRTGKRYAGGLQLWGIFVNRYKLWLLDRFAFGPGRPGSWHLSLDVVKEGGDYLRQLVNEPKILETGRDGRTRMVFRPRSHSIGVDWWDCEVYNAALADMVVGDLGWSCRAWAPAAEVRPPTPKQPRGVAREFAAF